MNLNTFAVVDGLFDLAGTGEPPWLREALPLHRQDWEGLESAEQHSNSLDEDRVCQLDQSHRPVFRTSRRYWGQFGREYRRPAAPRFRDRHFPRLFLKSDHF